jgi:hypothetical protein
MPASQSDYILRMIEQLGAALRRLRELLARGVPAAPEVIREAEDAQSQLFGPLWPTLRLLDADTAAGLVPDDARLELWIHFIRLEADAHRLSGDAPRAESLEHRAAELKRVLTGRT